MLITRQPPSSPVTLDEFFEKFYVPLKLLGKSERTSVQYRVTIRMFTRFLHRDATIADLNDELIPAWFSHLLQTGSAHPTINKHRRQLLAIARLAVKKRKLAEVPDIMKLTEDLTDPVAWTMEEMSKILQVCANLEGKIGPEPRKWDDPRMDACDFWTALIETLLSTGARIGVMMRLPPSCYAREERMLLLPAKMQKQRKDQWVPLSDESVMAIDRIFKPNAAYLFDWPYDRRVDPSFSTLHAHFRDIIAKAGLSAEHGTFHRIRRTRATYGEMASPGSAFRDLGHSDPRVTQRYISTRLLKPARTIDLIPRPPEPIAQQLYTTTTIETPAYHHFSCVETATYSFEEGGAL